MNGATGIGSAPGVTPSTNRTPVIILGLVLVSFSLLIALLFFGLQRAGAPPLAAGMAPQFEITSFDGQPYSTTSLLGKPVIVNFWASWCVPCRDEAPALEQAWQKYKDQGLVIIGVDYVDTQPEALKFISDFKQTYPNGPDLGTKVSQAYHITGVPETYFIGRDGKLLAGTDGSGHPYANWIGPLTQDALTARIQQLLNQ